MNKWKFYTANDIKPGGWLKRQLEIQAEGLSGNLDKVWPDVRDSRWIGGEAEGWERFPYWLDGIIPLAFLLKDEEMIAKVKKYMDTILSGQRPDGWICPCTEEEREHYETWVVLLISKVLVGYYECTSDERIPQVLYDVLRNYYDMLQEKKVVLTRWVQSRWYEGFSAIQFTYERFQEEWLMKLADILREQGTLYEEVMHRWERPLNHSSHETHIVNIAMAMKYEAATCDVFGEAYRDIAEKMYQKLYQYNGTPVGTFTGDECLSGLSPIQGSELCSIVELMYSYEVLYAYTGEAKWAERLELLTFNALPATLSDDMWTHQYDQMTNQIACQRFPGKPIFRTNSEEAHLFGLEPHYGCCTANFSQGWPKFTVAAFMHNGDTIINVLPVPTELNVQEADIKLETNYPFENSLKYIIHAKKDFTFKIRIPSFAQNVRVNGQMTEELELSFALKGGTDKELCICFDTAVQFEERPYDLCAVRCGSLVFAVPIQYDKKMHEYIKDGVERKFPYCDYELIPVSDWNYAYSSTEASVVRNGISDVPFSSQNPPVTLKVKVKKIDWGLEDGYEAVCAKVPYSRKPLGEEQEMTLYPYGCAKLRMTELPLLV